MNALKPTLIAASLAAVATVAVAQPAPRERQAMPRGPSGEPETIMRRFMHGPWHGLSAAGRDIMRVATQSPADLEQRRERERALDARAAELLAADRLDVAAMRRVMDEKAQIRATADRERQQRLLEGYQKLSVADRKALAEAMQNRHMRFDHLIGPHGDRIRRLREHMRDMPMPPKPDEQKL